MVIILSFRWAVFTVSSLQFRDRICLASVIISGCDSCALAGIFPLVRCVLSVGHSKRKWVSSPIPSGQRVHVLSAIAVGGSVILPSAIGRLWHPVRSCVIGLVSTLETPNLRWLPRLYVVSSLKQSLFGGRLCLPHSISSSGTSCIHVSGSCLRHVPICL